MIKMILSIIVIYVLYYAWIVFNFDKSGEQRRRKNKKLKMPSEVEYFVTKYKVDLKKVNYRYFLQLMGLIVAFDLSIVLAIMDFIPVLWIKCVVGFIVMLIVVFVSFRLLGNYFKKKGLVKDV